MFIEENNEIPWIKDQLVQRPTPSQCNMKNCGKNGNPKQNSKREFKSSLMLLCIDTA
jgi:hypothetical protein